MAVRKRFIAGAKCPACQAQDSLAMWRENNVDVVECVECGYENARAERGREQYERGAGDWHLFLMTSSVCFCS